MIIYQPFHRTLYYLADLNAQCIGCFFHLRPEMPCDGTDKMNRGMRMIMEELQLDEKKAKQLLQKYGSVKKVLDIYNKK